MQKVNNRTATGMHDAICTILMKPKILLIKQLIRPKEQTKKVLINKIHIK